MNKKDAEFTRANGVQAKVMKVHACDLAIAIIEHAQKAHIYHGAVPCIALVAAGMVATTIVKNASMMTEEELIEHATLTVAAAIRLAYAEKDLKGTDPSH